MDILKDYAQSEFTVKGSRFLSELFPCETQADARNLIKSQKTKYADSTHVVHAFVIGLGGEILGMSDDGEPSGTAGMPILEALRLSGVHDVVCVVVRYFGGIKLGAGGLVRAYSSSASEAIKLAPHTTLLSMHKYQIAFSYDYIRPLDYLLEQKNAIITSKDYDVQVTYTFFSDDDSIPLAIQEMSSGSLQLIDLGIEILEKDL